MGYLPYAPYLYIEVALMAKKPVSKEYSKKHLARIEKERLQRRYLMIGTVTVLVLVIGIILYGVLDQTVLQGIRPVAKVGNQVITTSQFQTRVRYERYQLVSQYNNIEQTAQMFGSDPSFAQYFQSYLSQIQNQLSDPTTFGNSVLDSMISDIAVADEAKQLGLTVSTTELDTGVQAAFGYYAHGTPTPTVSPTNVTLPTLSTTQLALVSATPTETVTPTETITPTETVTVTPTPAKVTSTPTLVPSVTPTTGPTATATAYTLQGYQTQVAQFATQLKPINFTQADLRDIIYKSLLRQKVFDALTKDLKPSEDEVWARHILVADQATATSIYNQLIKGADFCKLASADSTDTASKDLCGDLGWFGKGKMVAAFETAAWSMKIGAISQPVKSDFGYHVIQVLGHEVRPLDATGFSDYKTTTFNNAITADETKLVVTRYANTVETVVPTEPILPTAPPANIGQ
jgi:peptidyl-prolyl cis-trans isomerase D